MNPDVLREIEKFRVPELEAAIGFTQADWDRNLIIAGKQRAELMVARANKFST